MEEYALRLKKLRREKDVTQEELAAAVGATKSAISMYERGERKPSFEIADALADYFNVSIGYISGSTDLRGSYPRSDRIKPDFSGLVQKEPERTLETVTPQERRLLEYYRAVSEELKTAAERVLGMK